MRICEISSFFCYASYREKAGSIGRLSGEKMLLMTSERGTGRFHGMQIEGDNSINYILREVRSYFNWSIWDAKRPHLYMLSPRIIQSMRRYRPDIIVVDSEPFSLLAFEVSLIRRILFSKAKYIVHSSQNIYKRYPFPFNLIEALVMRQATALFARTSEVRKVLIRKGFQGPINVVQHGVDARCFRPVTNENVNRTKDGAPLRIGYVGALVKHKGVNLLIEAVSDLDIPFHLTIIGNGPERDLLKKQADSSSLSSRIQLKNGVPNWQLPNILRGFDVLVLPSITMPNLKEQFGRVIIEAMACGVPVVGSTCGSIPEVIGDGGLVFNEGNALELREKLKRLANDRDILCQLSIQARRRVLENYSWEKIAAHIYDIYQSL